MNAEPRSMYSCESSVIIQTSSSPESFLGIHTSAYFPEVVGTAFKLMRYEIEAFSELLNCEQKTGPGFIWKLFTFLSYIEKNPRAQIGGLVAGVKRELFMVICGSRYSTKVNNSWLGDMITELGINRTAEIGKMFCSYVEQSGYLNHRYHRDQTPVYFAIHNTWTDRVNGSKAQLDLVEIIRFACAFKVTNSSLNIKEVPYQEFRKDELTVLFSVNSYIGGDDFDVYDGIRKDEEGEIVGYVPHVNVTVRSDSAGGMDLIDNFFRYTLDKAGSANVFVIGEGHRSKDFPDLHI
jgi:hypothetical protein